MARVKNTKWRPSKNLSSRVILYPPSKMKLVYWAPNGIERLTSMIFNFSILDLALNLIASSVKMA